MKGESFYKTLSRASLIVMYLVLIYLCMVITAIIRYIQISGFDAGALDEIIVRFLSHPAETWMYCSMLTILLIIISTLFYASAIFTTYSSNRKAFRPGEEHGTSQWGSASDLSERFRAKNEADDRILSKNVRIDINDRKTNMNNNLYCLGGSGTGKTKFLIYPNLLKNNTSVLVTDPSGEILRDVGNALEAAGTVIRVLNTVDLSKSNAFNPFRYLRQPEDIDQLLTMIFSNTTAKGQQTSDPFWERSERMLDKAIMLYVYMEEPWPRKNLITVVDHLSAIQYVSGKPYYYAGFGIIIHRLPEKHPARVLYERVMIGAEDTVRSIIITALSRFSMFDNNPELERVLSSDEMELDDFGTGYHGDPKRKMALFCITPDSGDKTYNFLIGILYSQFFNRQYYMGDTFYNNRLPVPVMCWLDELANIALPEGFTGVLSTVRKRNMGIAMFFQDIAKTKKVFKDEWESLIGNADTFVYLGGNEPGSQRYISERLGSATLYTRSESRSYGQSQSSSNQVSSLGRPLIYASEVDDMDSKKCIIKLKGQLPVIDDKYETFSDTAYQKAMAMGPYILRRKRAGKYSREITILSREAVEHYKKMGQTDARYRPVVIYPEQLFAMPKPTQVLDLDDLRKASEEYRTKTMAEEALKKAEILKLKEKEEDILERVKHLSPEQAVQIRIAVEHGLDVESIDKMFNPNLSAEQMGLIRMMFEDAASGGKEAVEN